MERKTLISILTALVLIVVIGGIFYLRRGKAPETGRAPQGETIPYPSREEAMTYVAANIADLSPEDPILGGKWHVLRFWFADGRNFYAEYEDGHNLRRILVALAPRNGQVSYKVVGFFEPGEDLWSLTKGEDTQFGKPLELYEFDEKTNSWRKKT
ncbi:hypothetical protein HYW30_01300 [Candidatus Azambacteria bacterium]|nr:hypothetical protein [Candidatus Azambacteria bacterium]